MVLCYAGTDTDTYFILIFKVQEYVLLLLKITNKCVWLLGTADYLVVRSFPPSLNNVNIVTLNNEN